MSLMSIRSGFVWGALLLIALVVFGTQAIDQAEVENIIVVGELDRSQLASIKQQLAETKDGVWAVETLTEAVVTLDWVQKANVRRVWPSGYSVEVIPEVVIAYWNDDGFITADGQVISSELLVAGDLPHLYGSVSTEKEVMMRYHEFSQMLGAYGHEVQLVKRSERGSWTIETREKLSVLLGKEDLKARLQRFLAVSEELKLRQESRKIQTMDARYVNGVAVHFEEQLNLAEVNKNVGERSL